MSESPLRYVADEREVPRGTLTELFFEAVDRFGGNETLQHLPRPGELVGRSYREVLAEVQRAAAAITACGVEPGGRVAILSENRPEWAIVDYACLCLGVLDVPVYSTLNAHQVAYLLRDSGTELIFSSSRAQTEKAVAAASECEHDVRVVAFDEHEGVPDGASGWKAFLAAGEELASSWTDEAFRARALAVEPDDVATIIYTSGTTGEPKGVVLTHDNLASNVRATRMILDMGPSDNTISFLPLSHVLQRMTDYVFFSAGTRIAYPRSLETLIEDLKVVRPTTFVSVPRIYEKVYNGVMSARGLKGAIVRWAVGVADRVADLRLAGREPTGLLRLKYAIADKLAFSKVKAAVGGRLRYFVSGGGPLAPALNRFFYSIGLTILEGYGLTETSPVTNVNTLDHFRIGTVGKPIPGTEIKVADDGEILIRGPQVMKGYHNRPDATAEVLDEEGWFASGDIGMIDEDGFLAITDRKKDIIVTAGGKNIAPQPIENRLKTNRFVEQAIMVGDRRRYCSLLIVPAFDALETWAREQGLEWSTHAELVADSKVFAHMEREVFGMLDGLASYEMPKKIALLDEELTIDNGFLTPSMKVKRRVVHERLDAVIDGLYAEEAADSTAY